jgi:hypothetical protein
LLAAELYFYSAQPLQYLSGVGSVAHIPTAQAEAAGSGLIFDRQREARLHLKSKPPWSRQWGPVQASNSLDERPAPIKPTPRRPQSPIVPPHRIFFEVPITASYPLPFANK